MITRTALIALAVMTAGIFVPLRAADYPDVTLESLLTPEQQTALNVAGMSAQRREVLRGALIAEFVAGFQRGKAEGVKSPPALRRSTPAPTGDVIETEIDGEFEGWEGETIVKLMNGQIWQQSEYHYEYHYAYSPKVLIYPSGGGWKMKVEETDEAVGVRRLK